MCDQLIERQSRDGFRTTQAHAFHQTPDHHRHDADLPDLTEVEDLRLLLRTRVWNVYRPLGRVDERMRTSSVISALRNDHARSKQILVSAHTTTSLTAVAKRS